MSLLLTSRFYEPLLGGISTAIQTPAGRYVGDILDGADVIASFLFGTALIAAGAITCGHPRA
jgi:hypothetical protein